MLGAGRGLLSDAFAADPAASLAGACTLTKELTEGPYWIENSLTRRDITDGQARCAARARLHGARRVDVQGDRRRRRRGLARRRGRRLLRLRRRTGSAVAPRRRRTRSASCAATSARLRRARPASTHDLPRLVPGRTPHIHLKVHVGGNEVHTGQVFFPEARSAPAVYRTTRYRSRGQADTSNSEDCDLRARLAADDRASARPAAIGIDHARRRRRLTAVEPRAGPRALSLATVPAVTCGATSEPCRATRRRVLPLLLAIALPACSSATRCWCCVHPWLVDAQYALPGFPDDGLGLRGRRAPRPGARRRALDRGLGRCRDRAAARCAPARRRAGLRRARDRPHGGRARRRDAACMVAWLAGVAALCAARSRCAEPARGRAALAGCAGAPS